MCLHEYEKQLQVDKICQQQTTKRSKEWEVNTWVSLSFLPVISYLTFQFSSIFPHVLWSKSYLYYIPANWQYDEANTVFDDSMWTWGTDYILAIFMALGSWRCFFGCTRKSRIILGDAPYAASILMLLYCISVLSGGIAHQYYHTVESLNTSSFRNLWFICVGTVAFAGGPMGAIGSNLAKVFKHMNVDSHFNMPILPNIFWFGWSIIMMAVCFKGDMSYKRPPCDIFIAGTTQVVPSAYCILVVLSQKWNFQRTRNNVDNITQKILNEVTPVHLFLYTICWVLNAPLLPAYPHLLHHQLPECLINTMLHCNLFIAWSLQSYTTRRFFVIISKAVESCVEFPILEKKE